MFYTYVLKSYQDKKLYIGWTDNLKKRIIKHNTGQVLSTKYRLPFKLIYFECCLSKEKARKKENYFKTGAGRRFMKKLFNKK